ncbi:MAG: indole-3-glycerol phosphate synthase TrpC [Pirellulaceae bacterium]|nr:indole-3-glycerol phosphate synthase TrpC [Pirellulaceae bacterium]
MNILDKIVKTKKEELKKLKSQKRLAQLQKEAADGPELLDFYAPLVHKPFEKPVKLIAEVKKASPSKGLIREDFQPVEIAKTYAASGASCISVLTDEPYFQGSLDYLRQIRKEVATPLLRKDFIIDPYQIYEARAAGADAILLIAECLEASQLKDLYQLARGLGMSVLVEFYDPENLPKVVETGARIIGVNNRNLKTFETDLGHCIEMRKRLPEDIIFVGESGIFTNDDLCRLHEANIDAVLVGESLMRANDIALAVRRLLGR